LFKDCHGGLVGHSEHEELVFKRFGYGIFLLWDGKVFFTQVNVVEFFIRTFLDGVVFIVFITFCTYFIRIFNNFIFTIVRRYDFNFEPFITTTKGQIEFGTL